MSNSIDRKNAVRAQIRKFITATESDRLNMLTFGFEIETQSTGDGDECYSATWERIYNELDHEDFNDDEARNSDEYDRLMEVLASGSISDLLGNISRWDFSETALKFGSAGRWGSAERMLKKSLIAYAEKLKDRFENSTGYTHHHSDYVYCIRTVQKFSTWFRDPKKIKELKRTESDDCHLPWYDGSQEESYEYCQDGDYQLPLETVLANHPEMRPVGSEIHIDTEKLETVEDQSVSGVEIRTIGGLRFDDTVKQAEIVFKAIDDTEHYIDKGCSCHIHVQLNDDLAVNHYFGDGKLHAAIMEYYLWSIDRMPVSVQERIIEGHRHIEPGIDGNGKFQWVHFHPQGTIEHRLFGNVSNAEDLKQCLILTSEAMAYGYQVRFSDYDRSLTDSVLTECFENLNCDCDFAEGCLCSA